MWHEARKQEKALKGMMVNFQRRAERRREYYERTKLNPLKMLRVHGRSMKIHVDAAMAAAGDAPSTMMPWSGDSSVMISRFDVRAHLDYIPPFTKESSPDLSYEEEQEELWCNYERYRTLVQNAFRGISEEKCLKELEIEDMYPETKKKMNKEKAKLVGTKAEIGFDYEGSSRAMTSFSFPRGESPLNSDDEDEDEKLFSSESDYEVDMDVDMMSRTDVDRLNLLALEYNVTGGYFSRSLRSEKVDLRDQKEHRLAEREKSALHGKKSRKERKMLKESIVAAKRHSPRSYSMRGSPTYEEFRPEGERGDSSSRSSSPEKEAKIEYITSFGGEDKQKHGEHHSASSSKGDVSGSTATRKGGAGGSSRSGGMAGGRRESRGGGERRRLSSSSRSRYSEREWRSDSRRHRSSSRESRRRRRHSRSRSRSLSHSRSQYRSRDRKKRYSRSDSRSPSPRRKRRFSRSPLPISRHRSRSRSQDRRSKLQYSRQSKSRSRSASSSSSRSKSRSRSPPPTQKRYRRSTPTSSDDEHPSFEQESKETTQKPIALPALKNKDKGKMTPQEKLQKRLQAQISKQVKLDKKKQRNKEISLALQHAAHSSGGHY